MKDQLTETLNRFSDDDMASALQVATEKGYNLTPGPTSLEESLTRLARLRDVLADSCKKDAITLLPSEIAQEIVTSAQAVVGPLSGVHDGADQVAALIKAIDELNVRVWTSRLEEVSPEMLGHDQKSRRLEALLAKGRRLKSLQKSAEEKHTHLDSLIDKAEQETATLEARKSDIGNVIEQARSSAQEAAQALADAASAAQSAKDVQQAAQQELTACKESRSTISEIEPDIKAFHEIIDDRRGKLDQAMANADAGLAKNREETDGLIKTLQGLESQIKDQLQLATGRSLFYAFNQRSQALGRARLSWTIALAISAAITLALGYVIVTTTRDLGLMFYLKLTFLAPATLMVAFCIAQYRRERSLEEAYAFKSSLSLSLTPYQDLVSKIVNMEDPSEKQRYAEFLLGSISRIFTPPGDQSPELSEETLAPFIKRLKELTTALEPILKCLRIS